MRRVIGSLLSAICICTLVGAPFFHFFILVKRFHRPARAWAPQPGERAFVLLGIHRL